METRIGKYNVFEDENGLRIKYIYSISDLFGGLWFFLSFLLGIFLLYVAFIRFSIEDLNKFNFWILTILGSCFFLFGAYMLIGGMYNPKIGIFYIDKNKKKLIVRDLFNSEKIQINDVVSVAYEMIRNDRWHQPRIECAMLYLNLKDKTRKDCFVVRSPIPLDIGGKIDLDLHKIARLLREKISNTINEVNS